MSLPRRRSQLLRVDGEAYRWLASPHWDFDVQEGGQDWQQSPAFIDVYVEHRREPAQQLMVRFSAPLLQRWGRDPAKRSAIDPTLVERAVHLALRLGWHPRQTGETFTLSETETRFLRSPRHMLYIAPFIAQIVVQAVDSTQPGQAIVRGRVLELLHGDLSEQIELLANHPADQIPRQALVFLFRDAEEGGLTTWAQYGGVFMVAEGKALLYDGSGQIDRWGFFPMARIRRELRRLFTAFEE